jgi:hypothetical protein
MLSSSLRLGHPNVLFPSDFPTETAQTHHIPGMPHAFLRHTDPHGCDANKHFLSINITGDTYAPPGTM